MCAWRHDPADDAVGGVHVHQAAEFGVDRGIGTQGAVEAAREIDVTADLVRRQPEQPADRERIAPLQVETQLERDLADFREVKPPIRIDQAGRFEIDRELADADAIRRRFEFSARAALPPTLARDRPDREATARPTVLRNRNGGAVARQARGNRDTDALFGRPF